MSTEDSRDYDIAGKVAFVLLLGVVLWDAEKGGFALDIPGTDQLPSLTLLILLSVALIGKWTLDIATVETSGRLDAVDQLAGVIGIVAAAVGIALVASGWWSLAVLGHFAAAIFFGAFPALKVVSSE